MRKAARAIIIHDGMMLVMHRNKQGSQYYTLVGGQINDTETPEQGLVREVWEETGLTIPRARLVFIEEHPAPHNEQYIYLCEVEKPEAAVMHPDSEEARMNQFGLNLHHLQWVGLNEFPRLPFRSPQLQLAIVQALKKGFPAGPVML